MDPAATIVGALVAAAANLAKPAVQDAYNGLKALIKQRFTDNSKVQGALDGLEEDPETWKKPLETALAQTTVGEDKEIVAAADNLNRQLQAIGIFHLGTGDILTGQSRKVDTGGGDYVEGTQHKGEK